MPNKPSKAEIVKMILDGMTDDAAEEEDLIHLLVENKVSRNVQRKSRGIINPVRTGYGQGCQNRGELGVYFQLLRFSGHLDHKQCHPAHKTF